MADLGFILLAAGCASRMGKPKQLLGFQGMPLIRYAVTEALASGCAPVIVVCGAIVEPIHEALAGLPVEMAVNEDWEQGMGTSIRCGLHALDRCSPHSRGTILALGDQPLAGRSVYRRLLDLQAETKQPIVSAQYAGTVGAPVLFLRQVFGELLALQPKEGCKGVIQRHAGQRALLECPEAAEDIDTGDDYTRILELSARVCPS